MDCVMKEKRIKKVIIPYFSIGMLTSIFYLFIMIKFKWANTKIFDNFRIGTEAEINNDISKVQENNYVLNTKEIGGRNEGGNSANSDEKVEGENEEEGGNNSGIGEG